MLSLGILAWCAAQGPLVEPRAGFCAVLVADRDAQAERWELAGFLVRGELEELPIPLLTLSARVGRARVGADGIELLLLGDLPSALDARVLEHATDAQVLVALGTPRLVGPPLAFPLRASPAGGLALVPELVYQDGLAPASGAGCVWPAELPADVRAVAIPAEGAAARLAPLRTAANEARTRTRELQDLIPFGSSGAQQNVAWHPWPRSFGEAPLSAGAAAEIGADDQVFAAQVEPLPMGSAQPLELQLGPPEALRFAPAPRPSALGRGPLAIDVGAAAGAAALSLPARRLHLQAPPAAAPGQTRTLLLRVDAKARWETAPAGSWEQVDALTLRARALPPEEVAHARGIDFVHAEGPQLQLDIRPTMGPGLAAGDADGDGWVDLFLAQGSGIAEASAPPDRLFRNLAGQRFEDVTAACGIRDPGAGMGALFFDAEGDGDLDLYVANYGRDSLFVNDGRAHFRDATERAGIAGELWHSGVAAADYDADGDLDLYVSSYLEYDLAKLPPPEDLPYQRDDPTEMLPYAFPGQRKTLWKNESRGEQLRFRDVAAELGVADEQGRGMQPVFWDFDFDGDQDLYVPNDVSPNRLFRNEGNGSFRDVSFQTGTDDPRGSMGVAIGDIEADGDLDMLVTNWELEANALFVNNLISSRSQKLRTATFRDGIVPAGLGPAGIGVTKWGCELEDFDLDGDVDLFYANGYTSPDYESSGLCAGQPCHLFWNEGGRFRAAAPNFDEHPWLGLRLAHRAALACDFDQDGRLELAITSNNGPFRLIALPAPAGRHWLGLRLRGRAPNTQAIGAIARLTAGGRQQIRQLLAGRSYLAGNAPELHFGLGAAERVDALEIRWPDGRTSTPAIEAIDRWLVIEEPR